MQYQGLREGASLLLANGHSHAFAYPLWRIWFEAKLVKRRVSEQVALDAIAMHTVIVQALAGGKHLDKFLKEIRNG